MKDIIPSSKFRKDYKHLQQQEKEKLLKVIKCLQYDLDLPARAYPHKLVGTYAGCMDCHVMPDLVLIYEIEDDTVNLIRIGSHAKLKLA